MATDFNDLIKQLIRDEVEEIVSDIAREKLDEAADNFDYQEHFENNIDIDEMKQDLKDEFNNIVENCDILDKIEEKIDSRVNMLLDSSSIADLVSISQSVQDENKYLKGQIEHLYKRVYELESKKGFFSRLFGR